MHKGTEDKSIPGELTNELTTEERETHINWTAQDRAANVAEIWTDDPVEYKRLLKKGYTPIDVGPAKDWACFEIEYRLVSVRANKPKRQMSAKERAAAAERLAVAREKQAV